MRQISPGVPELWLYKQTERLQLFTDRHRAGLQTKDETSETTVRNLYCLVSCMSASLLGTRGESLDDMSLHYVESSLQDYLGMRSLRQFSGKNSCILISKDGKIVYNYFFGKLKILLNHGFPRPICLQNIQSAANPW